MGETTRLTTIIESLNKKLESNYDEYADKLGKLTNQITFIQLEHKSQVEILNDELNSLK